MRRKRPTHPLLAAAVAYLAGVFVANLVVDIAFGLYPDKYVLPAEYLIPLAIAAVVYADFRRARNRRMGSGLCPVCEYDLRASRERCPECGTPIQSNATTSR